MSNDPNREMLLRVTRRLGPLCGDLVLVGGCAAGVLVTEVGAAPVRMTQDVDMIVEVASYAAQTRLNEQLRERGFHEDTSEDAPLCRWRCEDLVLDVMPTEENILGFSNRWYRDAIERAASMELEPGLMMKTITAPYFLATKLEAFAARGGEDYWGSQDIEDVVVLLDGREELVDEVAASEEGLRLYLSEWMNRLLASRDFQAALPACLLPDEDSQERKELLLVRMRAIAGRAGTARAVR